MAEKSWREMVITSDPEFDKDQVVYEFGGKKREFVDRKDPYESAKEDDDE